MPRLRTGDCAHPNTAGLKSCVPGRKNRSGRSIVARVSAFPQGQSVRPRTEKCGCLEESLMRVQVSYPGTLRRAAGLRPAPKINPT